MNGYVGKIRSKIGKDKFICPSARIIIENELGEFLFIERVDNGNLGIPAGGIEENETITECIIRETKEETGLTIKNVQLIGISSNPTLELVEYSNGDQTQYFSVEFYTNQYEGELFADGIETKSLGFKSADYIKNLPLNEQSTFHSLKYFKKTGQPQVK